MLKRRHDLEKNVFVICLFVPLLIDRLIKIAVANLKCNCKTNSRFSAQFGQSFVIYQWLIIIVLILLVLLPLSIIIIIISIK